MADSNARQCYRCGLGNAFLTRPCGHFYCKHCSSETNVDMFCRAQHAAQASNLQENLLATKPNLDDIVKVTSNNRTNRISDGSIETLNIESSSEDEDNLEDLKIMVQTQKMIINQYKELIIQLQNDKEQMQTKITTLQNKVEEQMAQLGNTEDINCKDKDEIDLENEQPITLNEVKEAGKSIAINMSIIQESCSLMIAKLDSICINQDELVKYMKNNKDEMNYFETKTNEDFTELHNSVKRINSCILRGQELAYTLKVGTRVVALGYWSKPFHGVVTEVSPLQDRRITIEWSDGDITKSKIGDKLLNCITLEECFED